MEVAAKELESLGIPYEMKVISAHRDPEAVRAYSLSAESRGLKVVIAGRGQSRRASGRGRLYDRPAGDRRAHPHVGPGGLDSLLSMVQMPPGVPVATVAINGARNAAILAAKDPAGRGPHRPAVPRAAPDDPALLHPEMAALWTDEAAWRPGCRWRWRCAKPGPAWVGYPRTPWPRYGRKLPSTSIGQRDRGDHQHDVIAFVSCVAENVGEASKHIHYGLTSPTYSIPAWPCSCGQRGALLAEQTRRLGAILQTPGA